MRAVINALPETGADHGDVSRSVMLESHRKETLKDEVTIRISVRFCRGCRYSPSKHMVVRKCIVILRRFWTGRYLA